MKCISRSQISLTSNSQFFQECVPFEFLQFLIISRWLGRKNGSDFPEYLHNVTSVTSNGTTFRAIGPKFGSSDSIGSLKGQSEMSSDPNNAV